MSSVGLVREPVVHNLNLAVILAFISWVEPTLLVVATELVPSSVRRGKVGIGGGLLEFRSNQIRTVRRATLSPALSRETGEGAGCRQK